MPTVLERRTLAPPRAPDELAARRSLREQVARLEGELSQLFCSSWPRKGLWEPAAAGLAAGPRILSLAELEELRDTLAARVADASRVLSERTLAEERKRCLIEEMLLEPEAHRWVRVSNEDIGEPGCRHWHVRPRWGLLGMLLKWWRVVISSGCPLPGPNGPARGVALGASARLGLTPLAAAPAHSVRVTGSRRRSRRATT